MRITEMLKLHGNKLAPKLQAMDSVTLFPSIDHVPDIASVRWAINKFMQTGRSTNHSPTGLLARYIVAYCDENKISYSLTRYVLEGEVVGYDIYKNGDESTEGVVKGTLNVIGHGRTS